MSQSESSRPHYAPGVPAEIPPVTRTIDQFLFDAAQEFPERIAIDFLGRTFTYRELRHAVRKAQAALYRTGVRNGDVVALVMPNCPQHVVAFYAVLSLGATVAEHNPLAPAAELHEQLGERHGATVVIAWEQTLERLTADGDFRGRTYLSVDLSVALPFTSRILLKLPIKAARERRPGCAEQSPPRSLSFDRIVERAPLLPRETVLEPPRLDEVAVLSTLVAQLACPSRPTYTRQRGGERFSNNSVGQWYSCRPRDLRRRSSLLPCVWTSNHFGSWAFSRPRR